jgi:hypothetical protein
MASQKTPTTKNNKKPNWIANEKNRSYIKTTAENNNQPPSIRLVNCIPTHLF